MIPNLVNMPSGLPFLTSLAKGLREKYGDELQSALILLPTRRAVRAMGEAFVMAAGQDGIKATLLPRMRPLADICLLYTSPSPRDQRGSRMPSSA